MNNRNDLIVEWAVNRIEKEYKDDVSLLLTYGSYENGTANPLSDVDFYFIPKTNRAYELCKTFIVEGIGFDLFPMFWERVEGLAELNESLTPCLANVKVLYCNSEEDKWRFEKLQNRLKENLNNKNFMLDKAFNKMEMVMGFYKNMLFEEDICELRTIAGQIVMFLSDAVAYANQTYFSRGLKKQIEDLKNMECIPEDFVLLYESVIKANTEREVIDCCHKMIKNTRNFLNSKTEKSQEDEKKANYKELAELYQEIISTWNKIKMYCDSGDAVLAYISGTCLQHTLNIAARENGLNKLDLMSAYDAKHLERFNDRAMELQKKFVRMIEENGANIEAYNTVEEFINGTDTSRIIRIGIIGDFDLERPSHIATNEALKHCADYLGIEIELQWLPTESLEADVDKSISKFDGFWCAPGSPYKSMTGALNAIRFARENDYPFIGTCGGFQHAVIEYAQNKLGLNDVNHAENNPSATNLFITALSCSLIGETRKIFIRENSRIFKIYNQTEVEERYNCNFGVNPEYQKLLDESGFNVVGTDEKGEVRILELPQNKFFVATLFQPQLSSFPTNPHKLIVAYLTCAKEFNLLK